MSEQVAVLAHRRVDAAHSSRSASTSRYGAFAHAVQALHLELGAGAGHLQDGGDGAGVVRANCG